MENLKSKWQIENTKTRSLATYADILSFQKKHNVILPSDLTDFLKSINGTDGIDTDDMFIFYAVDDIKSVADKFINWYGFEGLVNTLKDSDKVFVFADYMINTFAYGIRLYERLTPNNEVFIFCLNEYKHIANSFSEFIQLYLDDSDKLLF